MNYCDRCGEHFDDGDGALCRTCHRVLCYVCLGIPQPVEDPDKVTCGRCLRSLEGNNDP